MFLTLYSLRVAVTSPSPLSETFPFYFAGEAKYRAIRKLLYSIRQVV